MTLGVIEDELPIPFDEPADRLRPITARFQSQTQSVKQFWR
jgi:hypothetical protein